MQLQHIWEQHCIHYYFSVPGCGWLISAAAVLASEHAVTDIPVGSCTLCYGLHSYIETTL